jgi:hypothetical protein
MSLPRYDVSVFDNVPRLVSGATIYVYGEPNSITPLNWVSTLTGLATLFQDQAGSIPLANPFTVDTNGSGVFYAAGGLYTVVATGGTLAAPKVLINQSLLLAAGGGAVNEVNGVPLTSQSVLNLVQGSGVTLSPSGGNVIINASAASIVFKVNGTAASSQTVQNLIAGAGMTITDGGAGAITFASSTALAIKVNGVAAGSQTILNLKAGVFTTIVDDGVGGITIDAVLPAFQFNGSPLTAQAPVNFVNGTCINVANPSAGQVQFNLSGIVAARGTPTSAGAPGVTGQILFDSGFIYVCTAGGIAGAATWTKAALVAC